MGSSFWNKNKKLKVRAFNINNEYFWLGKVGNQLESSDSFYNLNFVITKKEELGKLTLEGARPGYDYESSYRLHNHSSAAKNFAKRAYSTFLKQLKRDLSGPVKSLSAFKTRLKSKAFQFEAESMRKEFMNRVLILAFLFLGYK